MVDVQRNNRKTAFPVAVMASAFLGLLIACFVGWTFAFCIAVERKVHSRDADIDAAYNTFIVALLVECIVAVIVLVLACGRCFFEENKLNKVMACGLILAGATNLVTTFVLIYAGDSDIYDSTMIPFSAKIMFSLPCLFWIMAGLLILKLPGNEASDTRITDRTGLDMVALLAEALLTESLL
jgi:magnesium-transporting ATPase (P-type)